MYCYKCGVEVDIKDKFCMDCGADQSPSTPESESAYAPLQQIPPQQIPPQYIPPQYIPPQYTPPPYYSTHEPPPVKKKSRKGLWITLGSVAAVLAIAVAVYFVVFYNDPMRMVGKAFINLGAEVEERFEATPLKAISMLGEILEDGTVTVNFDYSNQVFGDWFNIDTDGSIKISSDAQAREYAVEAEIRSFGEAFDIEAYMNRERIAVSSQLLGSNNYGFRYDTFRDDVRVFGSQIGMSNQEMDMLADIVDQINEAMNSEQTTEEAYEAYTEVLTNFVGNLEVTRERTSIISDGENVTCTLVEFAITKEALIELFNEFYDVIENDETVRAQLEMYDNPLFSAGMYGNIYNEFLRELRTAIRDFERYYYGDITLSFFIGRGDRLLQMEIKADFEFQDDRAELKAKFTFGRSVNDNWEFEITIIDNQINETVTIEWDFEDRSGRLINTIRISPNNGDTTTMISEWAPDRGDFSLSHRDRWGMGEITGIFTVGNNDFRLEFDNIYPSDSNESLFIDVVAHSGTNIEDVDFVNIDKWGDTFLEEIQRYFMDGIFGGGFDW